MTADPEPCPGCGASLKADPGPVHAYIGASAACWSIYGQVLAKEYSDEAYYHSHLLTVDTYAVQHPGTPSRRSIQSVALHLLRLSWLLEEELEPAYAKQLMAKAAEQNRANPVFCWLDPPDPIGALTVVDIVAARSAEEHIELVNTWSQDVWQAWSHHSDQIHAWAHGVRSD